jgi:hypothetical protein
MVAGNAEQFDGSLLEVDAKEEYRWQGKAAAYLFSADSEEDFDRKWLAAKEAGSFRFDLAALLLGKPLCD